MKSNELMIGDWVLHDREPYQIRQLGIYGVDRDGEDYPAVCVGKPKGVGLIVERNEIQPIPLTPEILARMGFAVKEDPIYEYCEDEYDIEHTYTAKMKCVDDRKCNTEIEYRTTYGNEIFVFSSDHYNRLPSRRIDTQIEYVHELQHIMRICGIEKEITI